MLFSTTNIKSKGTWPRRPKNHGVAQAPLTSVLLKAKGPHRLDLAPLVDTVVKNLWVVAAGVGE